MTELVVVRGADDSALVAELSRLIAFLDRVPDVRLVDVAYTCSLGRGGSSLAVIAADVAELRARLFSARSRLDTGTAVRLRDKSGTYYFRNHLLGSGRGRLAFVYPGAMGFYPDMLRDIAIHYRECREVFDEIEEAMSGNPDFTPSSFIFPPAACYRHDADIFRSGAYAQALVSTCSACGALTRLMKVFGVNCDGAVGFAGGDLSAMVKAGVFGASPARSDRLDMITSIYGIVDKAVNHGGFPTVLMLNVLMRREGEIDAALASFPPDKVMLVVDFSPRQKTFAVATDFRDAAIDAFTAAGVRVLELPFDRPFNTPLCERMVPVIRKFMVSLMKREPVIDVYSCASASKIPNGLKAARDEIAGRWAKPVRFADTIRQMHADGYRVFLEVGPRGVMAAAIEDTLRDAEHAAIPLNSIHRSGRLQLLHALGQLVALGADVDLSWAYVRRGARRLDFDAVLSLEVRRSAEMRLSRNFPRMTLLSNDAVPGTSFLAEPKGRGAKAAARAAVVAHNARRQRQFDFGAMNPLVSDADMLESTPGVSVEIVKTFKISELPFLGDYAIGTSQLSYTDPNLKGLVLLMISAGAEMMAEAASLVVPNGNLIRIEDFNSRRSVAFERGELRLFLRAERVASGRPGENAVKVQLRDDSPNSAYTWPVMEAVFVLSDAPPEQKPASPAPLSKPRSVHWSGRDVYPARLCCGKRLRGIRFVEAWSETGLDYEVTVPPLAGNVVFTQFPMWAVNPILLETIVSGFSLWRSHEKIVGAFSVPFRMRRLEIYGFIPKEDSTLNCYLRLTGVTPNSHLCDILATDGNGKQLISITGWEEYTERVPHEYRELILQPAVSFITAPLGTALLGTPGTDVATAVVTDVPYSIFDRNEELWLKMLSRIVLSAHELRDFSAMTGSTARRTEWLFGRIAAKEAVRRYLKDFYQARWSSADIIIWPDSLGKPQALGGWKDYLSTHIDVAIAHTSQFIVALAAANARVGVDVESVSRNLSEEFSSGVFTPDELELAAQSGNASQAVIKFWCAKESVSKALGTGIRYSPREMLVTSFEADSGTLTVRLDGAWLEAFKKFKGRDIVVTVRNFHDHALASCFIPAAMFGEK